MQFVRKQVLAYPFFIREAEIKTTPTNEHSPWKKGWKPNVHCIIVNCVAHDMPLLNKSLQKLQQRPCEILLNSKGSYYTSARDSHSGLCWLVRIAFHVICAVEHLVKMVNSNRGMHQILEQVRAKMILPASSQLHMHGWVNLLKKCEPSDVF